MTRCHLPFLGRPAPQPPASPGLSDQNNAGEPIVRSCHTWLFATATSQLRFAATTLLESPDHPPRAVTDLGDAGTSRYTICRVARTPIRFVPRETHMPSTLSASPTRSIFSVPEPHQISVAGSGLASRVVQFLIRRRIRISLVVICALIAQDMIRGESPHNVVDLTDAWSLIGLLFVLAGIFFRSWAAGVLNKNAALATRGPYALTRNPLYFGSFLLMIGFCTIIGELHNYVALFFLGLLLYQPKIAREEAYLEQKFDNGWREYARSTPRLVPRRLNTDTMFAGWSFARWLRNEEYKAIAGACLGLVVFAAWFHLVN